MHELEISKIENIIRKRLEKETQIVKEDLLGFVDKKCHDSIERINNVYTSAINTLRQLDLKDATFLDIFEKTGGNVRVYEHIVPEHSCQIEVDIGGRRLGYNIRSDYREEPKRLVHPIQLENKKMYKIIVMAIEEPLEEQKNASIH